MSKQGRLHDTTVKCTVAVHSPVHCTLITLSCVLSCNFGILPLNKVLQILPFAEGVNTLSGTLLSHTYTLHHTLLMHIKFDFCS